MCVCLSTLRVLCKGKRKSVSPDRNTHSKRAPQPHRQRGSVLLFVCLQETKTCLLRKSSVKHSVCKTQNRTCQERSVNERQRTNARTRTHSITHTYTLTLQHITSRPLAFSSTFLSLPLPSKGRLSGALNPGATRSRQAF